MDNKLETIEKSVVALHQLTENEKIKLLCQVRDDWKSSRHPTPII